MIKNPKNPIMFDLQIDFPPAQPFLYFVKLQITVKKLALSILFNLILVLCSWVLSVSGFI